MPRTIYLEVDDEVHEALLSQATRKGQDLKAYASGLFAQYFMEISSDEFFEGVGSPEFQVWQAVMRIQRSTETLDRLKLVAQAHMRLPTEESAELFNSLCEAVGISPSYIMDGIRDSMEIPLVKQANYKLQQAIMFLSRYMTPDQPYLANVVLRDAQSEGHKPYLVKQAKREMGIVSDNGVFPHNWAWIRLSAIAVQEHTFEQVGARA